MEVCNFFWSICRLASEYSHSRTHGINVVLLQVIELFRSSVDLPTTCLVVLSCPSVLMGLLLSLLLLWLFFFILFNFKWHFRVAQVDIYVRKATRFTDWLEVVELHEHAHANWPLLAISLVDIYLHYARWDWKATTRLENPEDLRKGGLFTWC